MKYVLIMYLVLCFLHTKSQDTIIVYDVYNKTMDTILPVVFDTTIVDDHTSTSTGNFGNKILLSLNPPSTNLFSGSHFSDIIPVENFFSVIDYPIRTTVSIMPYEADTLLGTTCSGLLVGPDMVLTASHCVYISWAGGWQYDSLHLIPAYNNGQIQTNLSSSMASQYYIFKSIYNGNLNPDIALIKLKDPIGIEVGWQGLAFNSDTSYFTNRVFHKLSYPNGINYFDTTKVYNGDTLYYNYGYIDFLVPPGLGVYGANAIGGQGGSSLFYTDNDSAYFSYGVFSLSASYRHTIIDQEIFYQFKNIIENHGYLVPINQITDIENNIKIYPNPFNLSAIIQFDNPQASVYTFTMKDLTGRIVRRITDINSGALIINRENLSSGLYFFLLESEGLRKIQGKVVIQD